MHALDETICAIASPPGGGARGIVRLSGPGLRKCLEPYFRPHPFRPLPSVTAPTAIPGLIWLPGFASPLPCELYLWPGKRSYTGGPVAEIHTLGSPPLLEAVLHAACAGGAAVAQPGEFTLRACLAGRIDLTQAEAVLGVIDAATSDQLRTALAQLAGGLAAPLGRLRDGLLDLLADLEAGFDFADEDLPFLDRRELVGRLDDAAGELDRLLSRMAVRGDAAQRFRVVLVGRPNTGKSSLLNALAPATAALVSEQPGTTRDYLTADVDLDGLACRLIDTAGIAPPSAAECDIRRAAQAAAVEQWRQADVLLLCIDSTRRPDDWEREQAAAHDGRRIVVLTKVDRPPPAASHPPLAVSHPPLAASPILQTSSLTGVGLTALGESIRRAACGLAPSADVVAGTAVRCGQSLRLASECTGRARQIARGGGGEELVAAEIRVALFELGKVAGAVYTEDVLDRIFSRFCVGK
ncbi:MAG: GTPase [Thermoguttaceae bacterium]|jgi:tRNA modification GTPase